MVDASFLLRSPLEAPAALREETLLCLAELPPAVPPGTIRSFVSRAAAKSMNKGMRQQYHLLSLHSYCMHVTLAPTRVPQNACSYCVLLPVSLYCMLLGCMLYGPF